MKREEKWKAHRPHVGDPVMYANEDGHITSVEGTVAYWKTTHGVSKQFIWCFSEGLNTLHYWPAKENPRT